MMRMIYKTGKIVLTRSSAILMLVILAGFSALNIQAQSQLVKNLRAGKEQLVVVYIMNMPVGKSAGFRPDLNIYYDMYRKVDYQLSGGYRSCVAAVILKSEPFLRTKVTTNSLIKPKQKI